MTHQSRGARAETELTAARATINWFGKGRHGRKLSYRSPAKKTLICKLAAFCKQLAKGTPLGAALRDPPQTTAAPTTRKPECWSYSYYPEEPEQNAILKVCFFNTKSFVDCSPSASLVIWGFSKLGRALTAIASFPVPLFSAQEGARATRGEKKEGPGTHCLRMRQKVLEFWDFGSCQVTFCHLVGVVSL